MKRKKMNLETMSIISRGLGVLLKKWITDPNFFLMLSDNNTKDSINQVFFLKNRIDESIANKAIHGTESLIIYEKKIDEN